MAHWIIEDFGFGKIGGINYTCSTCGRMWNSRDYKVYEWDHCPRCNEPIDDDLSEYVEESNKHEWTVTTDLSKWLASSLIPSTRIAQIKYYDEASEKLKQLTGHDLLKLIDLFAAGWTLEPPKQTMTMEELRKALELDEENN